jgi:hypothetical protein
MGQISGISPPVSPDKRGGSRSSRNARWDAVDAEAPLTNGADADGEVVWFWRPDAGVKFLGSKLLRGDGGKKAVHRGEHVISRKTTAQGRPDALR